MAAVVRAALALLTAYVFLSVTAVTAVAAAAAAHPHHPHPVLELSHLSLDHIISTASKPLLLQFYSPACIHCRRFAHVYQQLAADLRAEALVARVDVARHRALALRFHVAALPTFFLVHRRAVVQYVGPPSAPHLARFVRARGAEHGRRLSALAGPLSPYWTLVHLLLRFVHFLRWHVRLYRRNGGNLALLVLAVVVGVLSAFFVIIHLVTRPPKRSAPAETHLHRD